MKRLTIFLSYSLSLFFFLACAPNGIKSSPDYLNIKFIKPTNSQKFIMSPHTLTVTHGVKCLPTEDTFKVEVNVENEQQQNITGIFNYESHFWKAESVILPKGDNSLIAAAKLTCGSRTKIVNTELINLTVIPSPDSIIKILPLGDSITFGLAEDIDRNCGYGYRYYLFRKLLDSHYGSKILFVGGEENPPPGLLDNCQSDGYPIDFQRHHEGHIGWSSQTLKEELLDILDKQSPHIILLHIGTNDLWDHELNTVNDSSVDRLLDNVIEIFNEIESFEMNMNYDIMVFLARILNHYPRNTYVETFNDRLEDMVNRRIEEKDKIILVDMEMGAGFIYENDLTVNPTRPNIHPTPESYQKMANLWYRHLINYLPTPPSQ